MASFHPILDSDMTAQSEHVISYAQLSMQGNASFQMFTAHYKGNITGPLVCTPGHGFE